MTACHDAPASTRRHRRSIRLWGYDYTGAGGYFVTICTYDRMCLFGDVVDGTMVLNAAGFVVDATWRAIPDHFAGIWVDEYIVMPNHVHGVLVFGDGAGREANRSAGGVGDIGDVGAQHAAPLPMPPPARPPVPQCHRDTQGTGAEGADVGAQHAAPLPVPLRAPQWPHGSPRVQPASLGAVIRSFKAAVTKRLNELDRTSGSPFWQRNYYEHVIRDDRSLQRIRTYIRSNPARWAQDRENPGYRDLSTFAP